MYVFSLVNKYEKCTVIDTAILEEKIIRVLLGVDLMTFRLLVQIVQMLYH